MVTDKKSFFGIDLFRLISAFLVVSIHTSPLFVISPTADFILNEIIARVAVPFFLMTSGYFLIKEGAPWKKLLTFVKKTAVIYLAAIVLYIPINIYMGYFSAENLPIKILKDIFFNGTVYHLWYLPAAITGGIIAFLLVKKLGFNSALAITAALFLLGALGDSYFGFIKDTAVGDCYNAVFTVTENTRNGIFFTPIFMVMGGFLAKREPISLKKSALWGVLFYALTFFEAFFIRGAGVQRRDSVCFMVFLLPLCAFLFSALLSVRGKRIRSLRDASFSIYIIHIFVLVGLRFVLEAIGLAGLTQNGLVMFLATSAASAFLGFLYAFFKSLSEKRRENKKKAEQTALPEKEEALV